MKRTIYISNRKYLIKTWTLINNYFPLYVTEGRGKKKKAELLLSILTLFKIFKVKVLLGVALLAILFIKKTLLLGALYLPSVLQSIKSSCKGHHYVHEDHDIHDGFGKEYEYYHH